MSATTDSTAEHQNEEAPRTLRDSAMDWGRTMVYAIALAVFLRTFFIGVFWIPSSSMEPTLHGADRHRFSDRVLVFRFSYGLRLPIVGKYVARWAEPKRGDVIVFSSGHIPQLQPTRDLIKRVVGTPGDTIEIVTNGDDAAGRLYVNGEPVREPEFADLYYTARGRFGEGPVTLAAGEYMAFGDNTEHSNDSRFWGPLPRDYVLGKAVCIYWPPNRIQGL